MITSFIIHVKEKGFYRNLESKNSYVNNINDCRIFQTKEIPKEINNIIKNEISLNEIQILPEPNRYMICKCCGTSQPIRNICSNCQSRDFLIKV